MALDRRRLCTALWALVYAGTDAANVTEILSDAYDDTSIQPPSAPGRFGGERKWRPVFDLYAGVVRSDMQESLVDLEWSLPPPPALKQNRRTPFPPKARFDGVLDKGEDSALVNSLMNLTGWKRTPADGVGPMQRLTDQVSWRENAAPTELLAPLEYTDDGVWRVAPTTMPRPPPAPPPQPADADVMAVGLTPPPPAAPTAAAPTVSATEAALQGQLDMLQQPANSAVPPPAPGPDVDTRAVTDDRNARDVTVQAGAGATEGERDLELRLAALQDPAITMQPVPLLRSQPGLLEKAEAAAEREAERVYARREAQRDQLVRGSWNMTADADGAHRIESLHGVDQAVLEQDDALKSAMARGGNKAIEVTTREMGARFTFVVYHVELSAEQTLGVAREAVTRPLQRVPLVETMLASAAATHPGCRLVVLTDEQSVFNFTGPLAEDIEVLRYEVVTAHLSLAKMVAMGRFVSDEIRARHTAHVVVADSDMVVVKHLQDVNKRQWDVALTWRAQPALMRVNAGLVLFHGQRLQQGLKLINAMQKVFLQRHRQEYWFGDQLVMSDVLSHVVLPQQDTEEVFRSEFEGVNVLLLPALIYNCKPSLAVAKTKVMHFAGRRRDDMLPFWESLAAGRKKTIFLKDPQPISGRLLPLDRKTITTIVEAPPHATPEPVNVNVFKTTHAHVPTNVHRTARAADIEQSGTPGNPKRLRGLKCVSGTASCVYHIDGRCALPPGSFALPTGETDPFVEVGGEDALLGSRRCRRPTQAMVAAAPVTNVPRPKAGNGVRAAAKGKLRGMLGSMKETAGTEALRRRGAEDGTHGDGKRMPWLRQDTATKFRKLKARHGR